jgi:uncharacterized protein (TIGR03067 family)
MKTYAILVVTAILWLATSDGDSPAVKNDLAKFQGTWVVVSQDREEKPVPKQAGEVTRSIIDGNRYTTKVGEKVVEEGTFKIDPTTNPKAVDFTIKSGPDEGKTLRGIYELREDTLRACVGDERPATFSSKGAKKLIVMKREK